MTPEQSEQVWNSWGRLAPRADEFAEHFYRRLFESDPQLRRLFPKDMFSQNRRLMKFLHLVVNGISCIDELTLDIEDLGLRHREYGVKPEHFPVVRAALLRALSELLGAFFTPEVAEAWGATYDQLAKIMTDAAYYNVWQLAHSDEEHA